ncbi:MAG: hypothetical protein ACRDK7_08740 [Solirubrobacteraceae bacterium]
MLFRPLLRYSTTRDAFVLRLVGNSTGPVLRPNRRRHGGSSRFKGVDRRRAQAA